MLQRQSLAPDNVYALADHLDAALAACEDLLQLSGRHTDLEWFLASVRRFELAAILQVLRVRQYAEELRQSDRRIATIAELFLAGTLAFTEAKRRPGHQSVRQRRRPRWARPCHHRSIHDRTAHSDRPAGRDGAGVPRRDGDHLRAVTTPSRAASPVRLRPPLSLVPRTPSLASRPSAARLSGLRLISSLCCSALYCCCSAKLSVVFTPTGAFAVSVGGPARAGPFGIRPAHRPTREGLLCFLNCERVARP